MEVLKKLSPEEISRFKEAFNSIDISAEGKLDPKEIGKFFKDQDLPESFGEIAVFLFDKDGDGCLNFDECVDFVTFFDHPQEDPLFLFKALFNAIDKDGNGTLDGDEMYRFCQMFSIPVTRPEVEDIIDAFDLDGDHVISFEELVKAFDLEDPE